MQSETTHLARLVVAALTVALMTAACNSSSTEEDPTTSEPVNETAVSTTTPALPQSTTTPPVTASPTTATTGAPTTTTPPTTDTTLATSTTTTPTSTTTPPPPTSTTLAPPPDNQPPTVTITSPGNLSSHVAAFDRDLLAFRAVVSMSAAASDPNGDPVTVDWYSSLSGYLGTGEFITASLVTINDSSQPYITARATDIYGAVSEDRIQVIVWVPSDT